MEDKTFKIGFDYEYQKQSQVSVKESTTSSLISRTLKGHLHRFHSEYRFDILKPGQRRVTWLHLSGAGTDTQYSEGEYDQAFSMPPYSQNEIQM